MNEGDAMTWGSPKFIHSPLLDPQPKLRIRDDVPVSDKFRAEMNQWLADTFGYTEDKFAYLMPSRGFAMVSNRHLAMIKNFTA